MSSLIRDLMDEVNAQLDGALDAWQQIEIEKRLRNKHGDQRVYIGRRLPTSIRDAPILADIDAGCLTYEEIANKHDVSKRTVIRAGKRSAGK